MYINLEKVTIGYLKLPYALFLTEGSGGINLTGNERFIERYQEKVYARGKSS